MKGQHVMCVKVFLILFGCIAPIWTVYLPATEFNNLNQFETIQPQQQQKHATAVKQHQQQIRHHTSYDKNDGVAAPHPPPLDEEQPQQKVAEQHNNISTSSSSSREDTTYSHSSRRQRRELSDSWLIAPNTRWCGRGNSANGTYNHLGGASSADKCCRKHDHCQMYISAMSNRFELFNYRPYTLSHCNCDRRFRTCLKMANDEDANTIGKLFFNMVQTQCFIVRSEKVCQQRSEDGKCSREYTKQKAYLKNNKKF